MLLHICIILNLLIVLQDGPFLALSVVPMAMSLSLSTMQCEKIVQQLLIEMQRGEVLALRAPLVLSVSQHSPSSPFP